MNKERKYSVLSNIWYTIKEFWKYQKSTVIFFVIGTLTQVIAPFIGIYLPKVVLDLLQRQVSATIFVREISLIVLILLLLNAMDRYCNEIINEGIGINGSYIFAAEKFKKKVVVDYESLENPVFKQYSDKADKAVSNNHTATANFLRNLSKLVASVLGLLLYGYVIIYINPFILVLLALSALINWMFLRNARKYEESTRTESSKIERKSRYLTNNMTNVEFAKDIRMYNMQGFLKNMLDVINKENTQVKDQIEKRNIYAKLSDAFLIVIRDGTSYAYLIYLFLNNQLSVGDFTLIFAAIGTLASWVSGILLGYSEFMQSHIGMSEVRSYIDYPDQSNKGVGIKLPSEQDLPVSIDLHNVSYTYPNSDTPTLEDINIHIKPGEKIAIVGVNGAGKTTLVKLISGLYYPKQGEVKLNGINIKEFNRDEYFTLFSLVFQDIHLTTTGIIGNVSSMMDELVDMEKLNDCLKRVGLFDLIQNLPNKEYTGVVRQINEEGVDLSGGEKQKLALARALYKDAPIIILDEPTAALDPIAENESYQQFAKLTEGKTSIYISHRLASTRFCDRILLLDGCQIVEEGTHDELINRHGKYAEMFQIQSSYYSDGKEAL